MRWTERGLSGQPHDKTPQNSKPRLLHQLWTRSCDATISHILILCTLAITSHLLAKSTAAMRLRVQMLSMVSFLSFQLLVSTISSWQSLCASTFTVSTLKVVQLVALLSSSSWLGRAQTSGFPTLWRMPCKQNSASRLWGVLGDWKNDSIQSIRTENINVTSTHVSIYNTMQTHTHILCARAVALGSLGT